MTRTRAAAAILLAATLQTVTACATRTEPVSTVANRTDPSVAGVLVIEQFLAAVNGTDVDRMAQLMGTGESTLANLYGREQVETRMLLLAEILKHSNYRVTSTTDVPARRGEAVNAMVQMTIKNRSYDIPFTLVWNQDRRWLIENVDVRPITGL